MGGGDKWYSGQSTKGDSYGPNPLFEFMLKANDSSLPWRDPDGKLTDQSWSCIAVRIFWCSLQCSFLNKTYIDRLVDWLLRPMPSKLLIIICGISLCPKMTVYNNEKGVVLLCIVEWLSYYCIVYVKRISNSSLSWRDPDGKLTDQSKSCIAVKIFWCSLQCSTFSE